MILADKIIRLRKRYGWSQEELAEKMNVSRQAVSKWEGAQSVPDLEKILQLAELFGVTTDYLLKDEIEEEEYTGEEKSALKKVTLAMANEFIEWRKSAAKMIAAATAMCILAVIPLIVSSTVAFRNALGLSEDAAVILGLSVLIIMVAAAVGLYVFCGAKSSPYEFLEKEDFDTEYGVTGLAKEKQKEYRSTYIKSNIAGVCLCVLSPIAVISSVFMPKNELFGVLMLSLMLIMVSAGVCCFILSGVRWASYQKLLKEGEFAKSDKKKGKKEAIDTIYWLAVLAVYLGWSFISDDWGKTWIVWPIAAIGSAIVTVVCNSLRMKEE